ncbi:dTDP-L-rhamnose 4-epimerase [Actinopolymorpha cephalotaxi]|uniref:dTDP-L-rhamnose 4-epimerase n=1 Tax=Actinopolymorpha cephalotaxi TaxID=504797 RepID=A0A1I3C7Z0_9ACTN|nr:NAD-dependent epimerase/dehydratase family protein [Actinopolymorpha cephalotaxi]NYH86849.1 dTDP-L-rhamnose 4-epimerase [Actinopolymorpha cephalotaxi]SFH70648.1 dTDP-L-rhamnose 4-epimerase [Actinopolymorpha cephalotaxi]
MRVLVTGGAGFIGSHVAELLTERGHDVLVVDALLPVAHGAEAAQAPLSAAELHQVVRARIQDRDVLDSVLPGVDAVCHQAAMVGHGVDPSDAPAYAEHNDYATACLLAAMHEHGVRRLVLASSMVIYGEGAYRCPEHGPARPGPRRQSDLDSGKYEPGCPACGTPLAPGLVQEDAAPDPRSTYAASKLAQENYASAWARQSGGSVWALRYHNVYGPRMPRDTPYSGVAAMFRSALERGEAPTVLEDGRQWRDFVHVRDVALANALAVEAGADTDTDTDAHAGRFEAVNVCSGEPHTIADLAGTLAEACGGPAPRIVGGARPGDVRHVVADPAKAVATLGFQARTSFADGVRAFATDPLR